MNVVSEEMNPRVRVSMRIAPTAHKGLLLNKFLGVKGPGQSDNYVSRLQRVCAVDSTYSAYQLAHERWVQTAGNLPFAVCVKGTVSGRLAIGLGNPSVTEIGCLLHHTYGVPLIPGSALKGMLRASLHSAESEKERWQRYADFLFGSPKEKGFATIYDAWWVPESKRRHSGLALDVITAHHPEYYTGSSSPKPPSDFDSPIPNHFLTVTGAFTFAMQAPNESWKVFLEKLLQQTLLERGVGAKKSAGYGRLGQFAPAPR